MPANLTQYRKNAANLLRDSGTFASTILTILLREYGFELFAKDVLEIYEDVKNDFDAVLPEENENRLNGLMLCITTDGFYTDPNIFTATAASLLDGDLGDLIHGLTEELSVPEMLWASYEVGLFNDDTPETAPDVQRIITAVIRNEAEDADTDVEDVAPYHARFLQESREELRRQLLSINTTTEDLDELI